LITWLIPLTDKKRRCRQPVRIRRPSSSARALLRSRATTGSSASDEIIGSIARQPGDGGRSLDIHVQPADRLQGRAVVCEMASSCFAGRQVILTTSTDETAFRRDPVADELASLWGRPAPRPLLDHVTKAQPIATQPLRLHAPRRSPRTLQARTERGRRGWS
jgi:hypothetical protein